MNRVEGHDNRVRLSVDNWVAIVGLFFVLVGAVVYQTKVSVTNATMLQGHEKRIDRLEGTVYGPVQP